MNQTLKRLFDVTASIGGLICLAPLLVLVAVLIKATSRGPAFYAARRAGRNGKPIFVWKFRTMIDGADKGPSVTVGGDSRVTRVGRFLRAAKIDELPQLWNILCGQMSVVGPRPESLDVVQRSYSDLEREVLSLRPGLTCSGNLLYYVYHEHLRPPANLTANEFYERELLRPKLLADLHYVRNQSLAYDLTLIRDTLLVMAAKWLGRKPAWQPRFAAEPPANWRHG